MRTAYNFGSVIPAETVKGKSITQPEQVMPLRKIMDGLRKGTLVLDMSKQQHFDIPEHEIDVQSGRTPESTNAAIHDATLADLSAKADAAGDDITAAPGFTIEDAADLVDVIESAVSAAAIIGGRSSADDGTKEPSGNNVDAGSATSESVQNKTGSCPSDAGAAVK